MERLRGPDSLHVVYRRFSQGVDVVKCVLGFIKEVGEVEQAYSNSLEKLEKSHLFNFHSNFLMQLLGSDPYEEIGTVKHTWSELGCQLTALAKMHAEKAQAYLEAVRRPLLELAPKLEEARKELKNKGKLLKDKLDKAAEDHKKECTKYQQLAEAMQKHWDKVSSARKQSMLTTSSKSYLKNEERLATLKAELGLQEALYREAHRKHVEAKESFDKELLELYQGVHMKETERVNTIKSSLQEFARTLSNTAPTYLESMQRIIISTDEIDSVSDINSFVESHTSLMQQPEVPPYEAHPISAMGTGLKTGHLTSSVPSKTKLLRESESSVMQTEDNDDLASKSHATIENKGHQQQHPSLPPKPRPPKPKKPARTDRPQQESAHQSPPVVKETPAENGIAHAGRVEQTQQQTTTPRTREKQRTTKLSPAANRAVSGVPREGRTRGDSKSGASGAQNRTRVDSKSGASGAQNRTRVDSKSGATRGDGMSGAQSRTRADSGDKTLSSPDSQELISLLHTLQQRVAANDYYGLLGVNPDASADDLAKARREKSRKLHPDHFTNDEEQKARAHEQLEVINEAYQNILKNESSRNLYNQLCAFRKMYPRIIDKTIKVHGLQTASSKLTDLKKEFKKVQSPLALIEELDAALHLIQARISKIL